ncbi:hypothetical protein CTI12_AA088660 [Artemisia annua]|uniref:Uncharacterized protein n=1 Tax=Artemisia annua TaxID=35608 RepID=A0A2U1Q142_ARTAN|nr:hypothetical protein CTI12_AA088660 [Artemisia annua]
MRLKHIIRIAEGGERDVITGLEPSKAESVCFGDWICVSWVMEGGKLFMASVLVMVDMGVVVLLVIETRWVVEAARRLETISILATVSAKLAMAASSRGPMA